MLDGGVDGFFVMGQNPAVGSQNGGLQRRALANLKWLVVRDFAEIETASFWRDAPEVRDGELRTEDIQTEVFLMPAASHVEKEGSFTQTQRLVQWRDKALDPPGDARSELWFIHHLFKKVRARYEGSTDPKDWPVLELPLALRRARRVPRARRRGGPQGDQRLHGRRRQAGLRVRRAQGRRLDRVRLLDLLRRLQGLGQPGPAARPRRRAGPRGRLGLARVGLRLADEPAHPLQPRLGQARTARPWSERKKYVWWDAEEGKWTGYDVPDFPVDKAPDYRPESDDAQGMDAISGAEPFMMMADGRAWLYSPSGLLDGPLPTHYEPIESPVENALYPELGANPAAIRWRRPENPYNASDDPRVPARGHVLPPDRAPHRRRA